MMLGEVHPWIIVLVAGAVGVALMYARDIAVRIAGAIMVAFVATLFFGVLGLVNFLLLLGLARFLAPSWLRPLRRSRPVV